MANNKMRATMHTGRTRKDGAVYSVKHNDRNYDLSKSDNVNPDLVHKNLYLIVDEKGIATTPDGVTFDQHEHQMYQTLFGDSLDAQNRRYKAQSKDKFVKTIDEYRSSPRTCPEEIIMQIGTKDDEIPRKALTRAMNFWLSEMQTRYGSNIHLLDIAVHVDEPGGIHAHVRWVYSKSGKDGRTVSQRGALSELGIERPDMTKPDSQYNNAKVTFTEQARSLWLDSIERSGGPDIIAVAKTPGKKSMTKEEYVADQIRSEIMELHTEREQLQQETENLVVEREQLQQEVAALREEKSRLQRITERLKTSCMTLFKRLARVVCADGRCALEHVKTEAQAVLDAQDELTRDEIDTDER